MHRDVRGKEKDMTGELTLHGPWHEGRFDPRALAWWAMTGRGPGRHGRGRHRGRHGGFGGPPFGGGFPFQRGGGPRARRGDVREAILVLLAEEPRNGYQLMQEIEQRSEGVWRPSPGSVYPALAQLEDEGLVRAEESGGRKLFHLTDAGRARVAERPAEASDPWDAVTDEVSGEVFELRALIMQVGGAVWQVATAGSEAQVAEAKRILAETRRALYRILAEDDPGQVRTDI
jgi:DNA-binding PadR family transcriptional regulator